MSEVLCQARSLLFVPASRMDRLDKALQTSADAVIVDLEDAVPQVRKEAARAAAAERLGRLDAEERLRIVVRINASATPWHEGDLAMLEQLGSAGPCNVMIPKAEDPYALQRIASVLGSPARFVLLIESLAGLDSVDVLARHPQVSRLAFGHLDFQLDLGMHCAAEEPELAFARSGLVAASRRAMLPGPIDGVTIEIDDEHRLESDTRRARGFGFAGKLCIHPRQVEKVHQMFRPSDQQVAWARRVLDAAEASGEGVCTVDGHMVDVPILRAAKRLVGVQSDRCSTDSPDAVA